MNHHQHNHWVYLLNSIQSRTLDGPGKHISTHSPNPVLIYADQGALRIDTLTGPWKAQAGQLMYFPGNESISIHPVGKSVNCHILHLQVMALSFENEQWGTEPQPRVPFFEEYESSPYLVRGEYVGEHIKAICDEVPEERNWPFQKLMGMLYDMRRDAMPAKDRPQDGIEQSIEYMRKHYHGKISREKLAGIAGLAPNSYWRSFKREKGISPISFLQQIRVDQAKALLSEGAPLKEAAEATGFGHEFYMSRVFKKWTGLSPSLYVKRRTLKVAVASRLLFQECLQAIGIEPVLAVDCYNHPLEPEKLYKARLLRQMAELKAAAPDLIIGDYSHSDLLDELQTIAPTVVIKHSLEWRTPFLNMADLVDRRQEAERMISHVEERVAEHAHLVVSRHGNPTLTMLQVLHDSIMVQGTVCHPLNELLYRELRLQPGSHTPTMEMRHYLQSQDVPAFQSDVICVRLYKEHPLVLQMWDRMRQLPFWNELPAVRSGRLHMTGNWLVGSWTPQGRIRIAEDITGMMASSYMRMAY